MIRARWFRRLGWTLLAAVFLLAGWRLAGFSKTQYASLHGWEHFQRCHCAVVTLLAASRVPGLLVKISDEGDYWPRRSLTRLRQNLDQMNSSKVRFAE